MEKILIRVTNFLANKQMRMIYNEIPTIPKVPVMKADAECARKPAPNPPPVDCRCADCSSASSSSEGGSSSPPTAPIGCPSSYYKKLHNFKGRKRKLLFLYN